jgi:hypothetical protein
MADEKEPSQAPEQEKVEDAKPVQHQGRTVKKVQGTEGAEFDVNFWYSASFGAFDVKPEVVVAAMHYKELETATKETVAAAIQEYLEAEIER